MSAAVDDAGDAPRDQLAAAMRAHVRFHTERRPEVIVADAELRALEEPGRREILDLRDRHTALFRTPIAALGVAQPGIVAAAAITMCTDVALWFRPDGPLDADGVADTFIHLILRGIER